MILYFALEWILLYLLGIQWMQAIWNHAAFFTKDCKNWLQYHNELISLHVNWKNVWWVELQLWGFMHIPEGLSVLYLHCTTFMHLLLIFTLFQFHRFLLIHIHIVTLTYGAFITNIYIITMLMTHYCTWLSHYILSCIEW